MKYNMWTPDDQQKTGAHFNTNRERITSTSASQGRKLSRVWFAPFVLCCILSILSIRSSSSLLAEYAHKESLSNIVVSGRSSSVNNDPRASEKCTGMSDKVLAQTTTHIVGRSIPKVVRFILQSKCIPEEVAETHNQNWKQAKNHTIIYYDQEYVDEYMSQEHKDFPAAASKYKCITDNVARMDLVKLMLLWDKGGIAVDFGNIPGPAFKNGDIISDADECIFEVDAEWATNPRFLACRPRHAALYVAITKLLAVALIDFPGFTISIEGRRSYFGYISEFMTGADHGNIKTIRVQQNGQQFDGHKIVQINTNRTNGELLTSLVVSKETMRDLKLRELSKLEQDQCKVKMINNSFEVDIDSLLELVGVGAKENTTCPEDLTYIGSRYNDGSILKGRKIPKIVHKTAKSKCFADLYVPAMHTWMFEDHSFFVHDDEAVNKLLNREWPEFPLLQQARSCIATGAGMADLWRYLVIWEYGGIYSDLDDAPGLEFRNGTLITDTMDSLFEQESGGFPSQYFFAASPKHPIMYHAIHHTIQRLLEVTSISGQYVPFVTGPGAIKCGAITAIGHDKPVAGTYQVPGHNRTVTVVGSRKKARQGAFLQRSIVDEKGKRSDADAKMGMIHYSTRRKNGKKNSCLHENYKMMLRKSTM